jgi:pimeloyl-ACP methyl ester carboxylesterase
MAGMLADDYQPRLSNIKMPTLILWGEQETIVPRAEQDSLVKAIPNAALKVYPEIGHAPHWERPQKVVNELEDFITGDGPQ